jgi:hypothetical protein
LPNNIDKKGEIMQENKTKEEKKRTTLILAEQMLFVGLILAIVGLAAFFLSRSIREAYASLWATGSTMGLVVVGIFFISLSIKTRRDAKNI